MTSTSQLECSDMETKISNTMMWHHGTVEKNWKDSGWVWRGKFYPCEYSDDENGKDKEIGRLLISLGAK